MKARIGDRLIVKPKAGHEALRMETEMCSTETILLIHPEGGKADQLDGWLRADGHFVFRCSGSRGNAYRCSDSAGRCSLAKTAGVIVLGMDLDEDAIDGVPTWELALIYRSMGKRLVVLAGPDDPVGIIADRDVIVLPRYPARPEFLRAVRTLVLGDSRATRESATSLA